jgi:hypothetical protein
MLDAHPRASEILNRAKWGIRLRYGEEALN